MTNVERKKINICWESLQNSVLEMQKSYLKANVAVGKVCAFGHINIPLTNAGYKRPVSHRIFVWCCSKMYILD